MDYQKTHIEFDHKHGSPLICCRFLPTTSTVFFGAEDFSVWAWDWEQDVKRRFPTNAWVRSLAFSPDHESLITGGYDGRLIWWNTKDSAPKPVRAVSTHDGWVRALAVSPDGNTLASVGNDRIVRLWETDSGTLRHELAGAAPEGDSPRRHDTFIYNATFHPSGTALVTGDLMGQLLHWDLSSLQPVRSWTAESLSKYDPTFRAQIGGFRSLTFDGDGTRLLASGITNVTNAFAGVGNPSVVVFDWEEARQVMEYLSKPALQGVAWRAVIHPSGPLIAVHGGSGGNLVFWEPGTAESAYHFKLPQNGRDLDLHANGIHLAVAGSDGHLRVCRMEAKPE